LASPPCRWVCSGLRGDDRSSGGLTHQRSRIRVTRRFPVVLAWFAPGASLGVSKERPSIGLGSRRPLQLSNPALSRRFLRPRLVLARGRVLFRLRGFPPPWRFSPSRVSRVCCTPQPILGFAASELGSNRRNGSLLAFPRRTTLRSISTPAAFHRVSSLGPSVSWNPAFLPLRLSCENCSTSRLFSAGRVRVIFRCCHRGPRTSSLGFRLQMLRVRNHYQGLGPGSRPVLFLLQRSRDPGTPRAIP